MGHKRRLWIADIHGNLPAFSSVLNHAGKVDDVIFLGDIVGCGPNPAECVEMLKSISSMAVIGNHDSLILSRIGRSIQPIHPIMSWDDWTYSMLEERHLSFLEGLPDEMDIEFCGNTAKVLHKPCWSNYLHPNMSGKEMKDYFSNTAGSTVICGHSHYSLDRQLGERRFICIPSVGQPRNSDPRAGYAIEEYGRINFYFVDYDIEKTVSDLMNIGLPEPFLSRWINFVRTGFDAEWSRTRQ